MENTKNKVLFSAVSSLLLEMSATEFPLYVELSGGKALAVFEKYGLAPLLEYDVSVLKPTISFLETEGYILRKGNANFKIPQYLKTEPANLLEMEYTYRITEKGLKAVNESTGDTSPVKHDLLQRDKNGTFFQSKDNMGFKSGKVFILGPALNIFQLNG